MISFHHPIITYHLFLSSIESPTRVLPLVIRAIIIWSECCPCSPKPKCRRSTINETHSTRKSGEGPSMWFRKSGARSSIDRYRLISRRNKISVCTMTSSADATNWPNTATPTSRCWRKSSHQSTQAGTKQKCRKFSTASCNTRRWVSGMSCCFC